jgi:DNA repair photolyase
MSAAPAKGDSLTTFSGEFLVSVAPLEVSFNYCSHKCGYCFANLSKPGRFADVGAIARFIAEAPTRTSLAAYLYNERYPVVASNRVDPLAISNEKVAIPVLRTLIDLGVPLYIYSRGGRREDELVEALPRSVWYVSLTCQDDATAKRIEPGAPSMSERYALIEKLAARGHLVQVGLNPIVAQWMPRPEEVLERAKSCGAKSAMFQTLHFNPRQIAAMTPRERAAIGAEVLAGGLKVKSPDDTLMRFAIDRAREIGLHVKLLAPDRPSSTTDLYDEVYPKRFGSLQDLVNRLFETHADGDVITGTEIVDLLAPLFPSGLFQLRDFANGATRECPELRAMTGLRSFRELLTATVKAVDYPFHPRHLPCLSLAVDPEDGSYWTGEDDLPFFVFWPEGRPEEFTPMEKVR